MSATLIDTPSFPGGTLRIFGICVDASAVERARWLARQLDHRKTGSREVLPQIWKLDSIRAAGRIQELLAQDAAEADVLVIAISSLDQREPALMDWLNSLYVIKQTCKRNGLLVGLFGDDEQPAGELAWLVNELGGFARQTGMKFLWQWMAEGAQQDTDWLEAGIQELIPSPGSLQRIVTVPEIADGTIPAVTV